MPRGGVPSSAILSADVMICPPFTLLPWINFVWRKILTMLRWVLKKKFLLAYFYAFWSVMPAFVRPPFPFVSQCDHLPTLPLLGCWHNLWTAPNYMQKSVDVENIFSWKLEWINPTVRIKSVFSAKLIFVSSFLPLIALCTWNSSI